MNKTASSGSKAWTEEEDDIVLLYVGRPSAAVQVLNGRTLCSIKARIHRLQNAHPIVEPDDLRHDTQHDSGPAMLPRNAAPYNDTMQRKIERSDRFSACKAHASDLLASGGRFRDVTLAKPARPFTLAA